MISDAAQSQTYAAPLQESEERYRALFLQEQVRARHLSLINEVQKCALATRDTDVFLQQVTRAIHSHFSDCDVCFFLCDTARSLDSHFSDNAGEGGCGELIVAAATGGHSLCPEVGSRWPATEGLAGEAAQYHKTIHFEPGQEYDPKWVSPRIRAGMCVPVISSGRLLGVVCMQSGSETGIDPNDAVALQTAAAIIASHLEAGRLFDETRELSAFSQTLITTMLHSLMVADEHGVVRVVNARLCQTLGLTRDELIGQSVNRVFEHGSMTGDEIADAIHEVTSSGIPQELPEVHVASPEGNLVFDVRLFRVYFRGQAQAVLLLINLTRRWRMFRQLKLMNEIGRLFQSSLDINHVLHTVLTCVTAGAGLGFNRAFLFLRHDDTVEGVEGGRSVLHGAMALGPSSAEEAGRVWTELGSQNLSLEEMLRDSDVIDPDNLTPLQRSVLDVEIDSDNPCFPAITRAMEERRALTVDRDELTEFVAEASEAQRAQYEAAQGIFNASQVAVAPLLAKDRAVGVVLADNYYSGSPIEPDDVEMLDVLAQQAGLTVANALTYQALRTAQHELVYAERLAAVGEMAARISHEIRNPLTTIGGFANSVMKNPSDTEGVKRKTGIIVDEISRLEELLGDLLDMARPRALELAPHALGALVEHAAMLADAEIQARKIRVEITLEEKMPAVLLDRGRALQAILNIVRNGAQAMPDGGDMRLSTRLSPDGKWAQVEVQDSGIGMSDNALKHVFDPFFSTKLKGSGLGLAITRRIMQDHDGDIDVHSEQGHGTTFILSFPLRRAENGA